MDNPHTVQVLNPINFGSIYYLPNPKPNLIGIECLVQRMNCNRAEQ